MPKPPHAPTEPKYGNAARQGARKTALALLNHTPTGKMPDGISGNQVKAGVDDREMKMALSLLDSLTADFEPSRYHDDYREKVLKLIEKKAEGEQIVTRPTTEEEGKTPRSGHDLMVARQASPADARGQGRKSGKTAVAEGDNEDSDTDPRPAHGRLQPVKHARSAGSDGASTRGRSAARTARRRKSA